MNRAPTLRPAPVREPESLPGPDPLPREGPNQLGPVAFVVAAWRPVAIVWGRTAKDAERRATTLFPDEPLHLRSVASAEVDGDNERILEREGRLARLRHAIGTARTTSMPTGPAAAVWLETDAA